MKRDDFLKSVGRKTKVFQYRGTTITGKEPTVSELRRWRQSIQNPDGSVNRDRLHKGDEALLAIVLRDEDGQPMFTMDEVYAGIFDQHPSSDISRLCTEVGIFVGIDPGEIRDMRDAAKNSSTTGASESSGSLQPVKDEP